MKTLHSKAALLAIALTSSTSFTFAQSPVFTCPIRFEILTSLSGVDGLDKPIYGLPVRKWTQDHLVQAKRRYIACVTNSPGPQSLRDAELEEGARLFAQLPEILLRRDDLLRYQAREKVAQSVVTQAGGSVSQNSGNLQWSFEVQPAGSSLGQTHTMACENASRLPKDLLTLTPKSKQELPRFYSACSQAQQIPSHLNYEFQERVEQLAREQKAQAGFIEMVSQAVRQPAQQTNQSLTRMENANRFVSSSDHAAMYAINQLVELRQQVDVRECTTYSKQAGVPAELRTALYLWRFQEQTSLAGLLCDAVRNGASFKFSPKGMFSKDSFEVAAPGKKTVRVTMTRHDMGESKINVLIPVESRIDGRTAETTRANWPNLTAALQDVMGVK